MLRALTAGEGGGTEERGAEELEGEAEVSGMQRPVPRKRLGRA